MEFHDYTGDTNDTSDTTYDAGADIGADHDGDLGGTAGDDHFSMIANDDSGSDHSDYGDNSYGDSSSSDNSYGDDSSSGAGGSSGDAPATGSSTVSIQVDGHTYTEAATVDSDGDSVARVSLPDGDSVIAVDTDHDGQADGAAIVGSDGKLIDVQHEDKSTGEWIDDGVPGSDSGDSYPAGDSTSTTGGDDSYPGDTSTSDSDSYPSSGDSSGDGDSSYPSDTSSSDGDSSSTTGPAGGNDGSDSIPPAGTTAAGTISIDAGGQHFEGAETIDVNQDGHADSAVVEEDGKTYLLTDFDGDGHADHVEVGQDGQWKGGYSVSASGEFTPDPGTTPDENDLPNNYAVDPQTGEWVSNNN